MKRVCLFLMCALFSSASVADEWIGSGVIEELWFYPDYVIVKQGSGGSAECNSENMWSFNWSDFSTEHGNRVMSVLLSAYAAGTTIQVTLDPVECGPEGFKKFAGRIHLL